MKRTSFSFLIYLFGHLFLMLVLEGGVGLHRTGQLQILWLQGLGIDMDYCDIEWSALECTKIILSFGGLHPSTAVLTLL